MDLKELNKVVESFDQTGIGRCFALLATLAEMGLEVHGTSENATKTGEKQKIDNDPLYSPAKAAEYLCVSVKTLQKYKDRHGMESTGTGKARRYRKSELERVIRERGGNTD